MPTLTPGHHPLTRMIQSQRTADAPTTSPYSAPPTAKTAYHPAQPWKEQTAPWLRDRPGAQRPGPASANTLHPLRIALSPAACTTASLPDLERDPARDATTSQPVLTTTRLLLLLLHQLTVRASLAPHGRMTRDTCSSTLSSAMPHGTGLPFSAFDSWLAHGLPCATPR